jgi:hypothetical protein
VDKTEIYDVAIERSREFLELFLNPTDTKQIAAAMNAVLAGNEGKSLAIK